MCHIMNMGLTQGIVPLRWKLSRVTPIYKKREVNKKNAITDQYRLFPY